MGADTLIQTPSKKARLPRFRTGACLLFLFGLAVAATSVTGVVLNYSPVPWWDQWFGTVNWYMQAEQHWWPSFWSLHNEHRLLFSRLIFWPDMRWFGGVNVLSLAGNVAVCAALAFASYRSVQLGSSFSRTCRLAVAGFVMAFCFSWMQSDNFTWGFQNQWFAVNLFALLAFHSISVSAARGHGVRLFVVALLCNIAASFSMANDTLAWPLSILLVLYWRFPLRMLVTLVVTFLIVAAANFWRSQGATGSIPHGTLAYVIQHQIGDLIRYGVRYLGSPMFFAFRSSPLATFAGAVVLVGAAWGTWTALRSRQTKAPALLAFAIFLCLTAFATGVGRLVLGLGNVYQPRYATNALLAWMALLLFGFLNVQQRPWRRVVGVCALVALVAVGVSQRKALSPDRDVMFERLVAGQAIREGVYDHAYLGVLWDHDDYLKTIIEAARAQKLSILAPEAPGYDHPPARILTDERCEGYIDGTAPTETQGMSRAEGWVFDRSHDSAPKTVVVTDGDGNTIGNGVVGKARADAAAALGKRETRVGWVAFYRTTPNISVFAKTREGGYCRLK